MGVTWPAKEHMYLPSGIVLFHIITLSTCFIGWILLFEMLDFVLFFSLSKIVSWVARNSYWRAAIEVTWMGPLAKQYQLGSITGSCGMLKKLSLSLIWTCALRFLNFWHIEPFKPWCSAKGLLKTKQKGLCNCITAEIFNKPLLVGSILLQSMSCYKAGQGCWNSIVRLTTSGVSISLHHCKSKPQSCMRCSV